LFLGQLSVGAAQLQGFGQEIVFVDLAYGTPSGEPGHKYRLSSGAANGDGLELAVFDDRIDDPLNIGEVVASVHLRLYVKRLGQEPIFAGPASFHIKFNGHRRPLSC
jgi:hypothetical protein